MSKRFGRNQKRKLRDRISSLESLADSNLRKNAELCYKLREFGEWEKRLNRVIPQYSALRKTAPVVRRRNDPGDSEDLRYIDQIDLSVTLLDDPNRMEPIHRLRMNIMRVESHLDDFSLAQRYELRIGSRPNLRVMYAISDNVLKINDLDDAVRYVALEVAKNMIEHVKHR